MTFLKAIIFIEVWSRYLQRSIWHSLQSPEKGASTEQLPRADWPLGMSWGGSLFLTDAGVPRPLWAATFPRQVVLVYIRKLAKHEPKNEPTNKIPPWPLLQETATVPAPASLSDRLWLGSINQVTFLPLRCFFFFSVERKPEQGISWYTVNATFDLCNLVTLTYIHL